MKLFFKRLGAYFIDILIVTIISVSISSIKSINYQYESYNDLYNEMVDVTEKFQNKEIEEEEYTKKLTNLNYKIDKNSTLTTFISIACIIGYFVIFAYSQDGRTIGKRVFKLQVVKNNEGNLNLVNYFLRSLVLNNLFFTIVRLISIMSMNKGTYITSMNILNSVQLIVQILIVISLLISKEGRGIHDYIAGTKVIDLKNNNVIEGEIIK